MKFLTKMLITLAAPTLLSACVIDDTYSTDNYGNGYSAQPASGYSTYPGRRPNNYYGSGYSAQPASGYSANPSQGGWGSGAPNPVPAPQPASGGGYSAAPAGAPTAAPVPPPAPSNNGGWSAGPAAAAPAPAASGNVIPVASPAGIGDAPSRPLPSKKIILKPKVAAPATNGGYSATPATE